MLRNVISVIWIRFHGTISTIVRQRQTVNGHNIAKKKKQQKNSNEPFGSRLFSVTHWEKSEFQSLLRTDVSDLYHAAVMWHIVDEFICANVGGEANEPGTRCRQTNGYIDHPERNRIKTNDSEPNHSHRQYAHQSSLFTFILIICVVCRAWIIIYSPFTNKLHAQDQNLSRIPLHLSKVSILLSFPLFFINKWLKPVNFFAPDPSLLITPTRRIAPIGSLSPV